jgi:HD superfamily phosphohydrolase
LENIKRFMNNILSKKIFLPTRNDSEVRSVTMLGEEKVFKDPVHKYIYVQDQLIWDLINTPEFQRLRRIRQLGTSYLTFHGAEHSRFNHSLGVYEVVRKIISQFERNGYEQWCAEDRLLVLSAALLHDLGHAPFSHSMERVFGTHHEMWSCRLILEDTQVNQILKKKAPDFPEQVASVIAKTHPNQLLVSMVSSQLDADRMDYLLRDAYYTGVNYGTFDLERILRVIRPHEGHIVVKASGMRAVEDYLMSRYQMYWQVYLHPVTRSAEIILRNIFKRAKQLFVAGYSFPFLPSPLIALFSDQLDMEQFLLLDEPLIQVTVQAWQSADDTILSDLSKRFVNRNLFKYVSAQSMSATQWQTLQTKFSQNGMTPEYYLATDDPSDQPYHEFREHGVEEKLPILILDEQGRLREISEVSEIVHALSGMNQEKQPLLFYPDDLYQSRIGGVIDKW